MKHYWFACATTLAAAVAMSGCAAGGDRDAAATAKPSSTSATKTAGGEQAVDLTRLSDEQLATKLAEQWARLRSHTNQSVDHALRYEGTNLAQDSTYRRMQADIVVQEQMLTQLQDEQSRRAARRR